MITRVNLMYVSASACALTLALLPGQNQSYTSVKATETRSTHQCTVLYTPIKGHRTIVACGLPRDAQHYYVCKPLNTAGDLQCVKSRIRIFPS